MHVQKTFDRDLEIGAKLGAIIQDSGSRTQLIENPTEVLADVGVSADIAIFADTADMVHLVVPAKVDADRIAAGDEAYFEELGKAALGNCYYEDVPE
ncbi:hypothetical protein [Roseibium marinum]|uniref:NHLP leader peptide family natural product n=1 Tax=Roseibium marinum TaxID=281252 RepID=A0A2S3UNK9_9HYPH|nr:hypothetical protein [Roseibium marinum]POF29286.1 hypothetical protein CLV41_10959 [Roseibium marinum]